LEAQTRNDKVQVQKLLAEEYAREQLLKEETSKRKVRKGEKMLIINIGRI